MAPRLDHREQDLPGVQIHWSMSGGYDKRRVVPVEVGVAFSKAVNSRSSQAVPKHDIAVKLAGKRPDGGVACKRAVVIGPAPRGVRVGVSSSGVIGNAVGNVRQRQLPRRRRARASAQPVRARIFANGCASGRAAMSRLSSSTRLRAGVFAVWPAGWRYDACWIARRGIGNDDGTGDSSG